MRQFLQYLLMGALLLIGNSVFAESEVTFQAGDFTAATSSDYSLTKEGVTVAVAGSTVTADEMRIFKNKTITISSTVGNITKVVFNCTASGDAKYGPGCFDDATAGTYSYDDKVGTWVGNAAEFSLTAKTNQVRVTSFVVTIGGTTDTRTATTIQFAEGYQTQIAKGPDDMFPEIGSSVALPTATVMADSAAVAGANVEWSLEVKSWKSKSEGEQPILNNGRISFEGYGVVDVKATYSGNDTYQASSKSYTLTVYNSYGKLSEMVNDVVDINGDKDDEDDRGGSPVFYFFRDIDADGFPPLLNTVTYANGIYVYLTDGEGNNLLFYGNNTQNLKQGDKISGNVGDANLGGFWGNLKRYKKLPEFAFTDMNVKVESEGNAVEPTIIAADKLAEYINAYVKIENAQFVSVDKKSLVFKVDETELAVYNQFGVDIDSLEVGATYTLTGMGAIFNTAKQLYLIEYAKTGDAVIIDPQPVDTVHIANTAETAYTIAEAIRLIEAGQALDETVFVKGFISQIDKYNEKYGSITYWISLDGTTESLHLECYNGMGLEGASFATVDDIEIGAEVIVKGQLKKYNDIYEFNQNNELVSYKAPEATVIIDPNAKGQQNNPYLITDEEFLEMVMNLDTEGSPLSDVIYVKGYITNIDEVSPNYGNARFKIAAVKDKDAEIKLSVYRARYLDNSNFTAEDQIGIFDEVVICGQIKWFNGSPEFVQGCYVYSQQKDSTTVIVNPQPTEPQITHTWDFTKWSEATIANLKADAAASKLTGWSDVEKRADAEADADPTEAAKDNCFWLTDAEGGELTANGVVIEELKGLLFDANYTARRYMAIAVNYPSTSLGDYNGASYLWLGSKSIECFTIPSVKAGSIIKMGVESHKNTDARGVKLLVNGIELTDPEGNAVAAPTAYTEQTWQVPAGDSPVDIVVKNTYGCHIYFIDAEQETETSEIPETSYTFEWVAADQGYKNMQNFADAEISLEGYASMFCERGWGKYTPEYYDNGKALRFYVGNSIVFRGNDITKIVITCDTTSAGFPKITVSTGEVVMDKNLIIWTGNSDEVAITVMDNLLRMLKLQMICGENEYIGKLGDVNHDDAIDVTDAVLIIDDILLKNPANYDASLADINGDSEIDVTDVVMVIDAILGKIELSRGAEPIDRSAYTAFQMDLTIPAGYVLESVSLTDIAKNSHSLAYAMLPDGRCRVIVCSMNNEALPGAWDEVVCLNLRGKGDAQMTIDRAVFVTIDGERHELMMNPTSIAQISNLKSQTSNLYDLQGRKVGENAKGILIENGKKVVKK